MKNKKKNLIEALYGSFMFIDNLPDLIDKENIHDENGYVDTEFLTAILEWMSRMAATSLKVQQSLNRLLGVEDIDKNSKSKDDKGSKWSVEEILKHCTLENNVIKLPNVQFNKKSYAEAKKWIEEAGGSWEGGKTQGFTFPFNAERVFKILHDGKRCNLQQEFQFFSTPPEVADYIVMLSGGVSENEKILEPSAGTGAIIDAIHRSCSSVIVDCFELMPENKEILSKKDRIRIIGDDFYECDSIGMYDKILANPPFSKNQDIKHLMKMYEHINEGGVIVAITSDHWRISKEKICTDFSEWLNSIGGEVYDIDEGSFKESGTSIKTSVVVIKKNKS